MVLSGIVLLLLSFVFVLGLFGENTGVEGLTLVNAMSAKSMGWLTWTFMIPGMIASVLIALFVPFAIDTFYVDYRNWTIAFELEGESHVKEPPSDLPAAAVSVLRSREMTGRTLGTIVLEMCQKGILAVTARPCGAGQDGKYKYRVTVPGEPDFPWEHMLCDDIKEREVAPGWIKSQLHKRKTAIGKQLGRHLQEQGFYLYGDNPMEGFRWIYWPWILGIVLMIGAVTTVIAGYAIAVPGGTPIREWVGVLGLLGFILMFWALLMFRRRKQISQAEKPQFNAQGLRDFRQWLSFRKTMWRQQRPEEEGAAPYRFLPYAFALGVSKPWMFSGITKAIASDDSDNATRPLDTTAERGSGLRPADAFYVGWMAGEFVGPGDGGLAGADLTGLDLDIDFDLSL